VPRIGIAQLDSEGARDHQPLGMLVDNVIARRGQRRARSRQAKCDHGVDAEPALPGLTDDFIEGIEPVAACIAASQQRQRRLQRVEPVGDR
jgi:hypothetical protein